MRNGLLAPKLVTQNLLTRKNSYIFSKAEFIRAKFLWQN